MYEAAQSCRAKIEQLVGNEEKEKKEYDKVIFFKKFNLSVEGDAYLEFGVVNSNSLFEFWTIDLFHK